MEVSHQLPVIEGSQNTKAAQKASWKQDSLQNVILAFILERGFRSVLTFRSLKTMLLLSRCNRDKNKTILDVFSLSSTHLGVASRSLQPLVSAEYCTARQVSSRRQLARHSASSMFGKYLYPENKKKEESLGYYGKQDNTLCLGKS